MSLHEVQRKPGTESIGIFPTLEDIPGLVQGFTWYTQENMALGQEVDDEGKLEARNRYEQFRTVMGCSEIPIGVSLEPVSDGKQIFFISSDDVVGHIQREVKLFCSGINTYLEPMHIEGNFVFTFERDLPLFVKPGDCPCAIIYWEHPEYGRLLGLLHAGREQLDTYLPQTVFDYLINDLGCDPTRFSIGIAPSISQQHYTIKTQDYHLLQHLRGWESYMKVEGENLFLDLGKRLHDDIVRSGIPEQNIFQYKVDTYEAAQNGISFSHRYATETKSRNGRFIVAAQLV